MLLLMVCDLCWSVKMIDDLADGHACGARLCAARGGGFDVLDLDGTENLHM